VSSFSKKIKKKESFATGALYNANKRKEKKNLSRHVMMTLFAYKTHQILFGWKEIQEN